MHIYAAQAVHDLVFSVDRFAEKTAPFSSALSLGCL